MRKKNIAILLSGRGSNAKALIDAAQADDFPGRVAVVISNNPKVGGLEIAQKAHIPNFAIDHRLFGKDRNQHEQAICDLLSEYTIDLICLAGYMRLLKETLLRHYPQRILNIHPSLLPAFPGLHTHERAIERGVKIHGCTVHQVTSGMDTGPILDQRSVRVSPLDQPASLAQKVLREEHILYPQVVRQVLTNKETPLP